MPIRILTIIYCLFFYSSFGQNNTNIDSLKSLLKTQKSLDQRSGTVAQIVSYYNRNEADSCSKYLKLEGEINQKWGDQQAIARHKLHLANHLQNTGKFEGSLRANQEAIDIFEKINDHQGLGDAYNSLGLLYKKNSGDDNQVLEFSKKALEYEFKSKAYYLLAKDYESLLRVYSNIGIIYRDLDDYKKAEEAYSEGIALAKKLNYSGYSLGILKANFSQLYLDYYKEYPKAIPLLYEAIAIYEKNGVRTSMEHAYRNLSYNYTRMGDHVNGIKYGKMAVEVANEVKDPFRQINAYKSLHFAQKEAGQYKESLDNLEYLTVIEDSLFSLEKTNLIAEMNAKFETVKKEAEIQVLTKTNQYNTLKIWALVGMLISLGLFLYYFWQSKQKEQIILVNEAELAKAKSEKAELELESKKKELAAKVLQLAHKNEFLNSLEGEIEQLKINVDSTVTKTSQRISRMIKRDIDSDEQWEQFSQEFGSIHKGFLNTLTEKYGSFSKSEIRLISLLKMNLSSKGIADILGISNEGIKKARYRLRKKMNLEDAELQSFLLSF